MKLSNLLRAFAEYYVDEHEEEICEAISNCLEVDLDEIAESVAEYIGDQNEAIKDEILSRM